MVPRSTKPCERTPAGEERVPTGRRPGIPLSSLDLHSWTGGMACVAATNKPAATGLERPQKRQQLDDHAGPPLSHLEATAPPKPSDPVSLASTAAIPGGPSGSLTDVIQAWPRLPQPIQTAITAIIHAALDSRAG